MRIDGSSPMARYSSAGERARESTVVASGDIGMPGAVASGSVTVSNVEKASAKRGSRDWLPRSRFNRLRGDRLD
jgi:hypothetical protein